MTHTDPTEPSAAHTPEPWHVDGLADNETQLWVRTRNRPIANVLLGNDPDADKANARRIAAAVNACEGLSTEVLEHGVVAQLRHALGALLTAAADLDAAIDGVTDQFDPERCRLDAACRNAQAVLDDGTEIDLHELLAARGQIALGWSVEDVQEVRPDLTGQQAWEVLQQVERQHDATLGVTWDTLELVAENLFGDAPETAAEEE